MDRIVQLIIDRCENQERKIETGISQSSPVLPILFLIYINRVFYKIQDITPSVTSLSFLDDLEFIALGSFVKKIGKIFEEVTKTVLQWIH